MPSNLKIVATNTFNEVDTTTDKLLLPPNKARYMLNCNILSQGEGNVGIVTNHKGNKQIEFTLPAGENVCIGTATDEENNVFYFFIWNSGGLHTIYQYNALTKQVNRLIQNLTDTANINILNFSKEFLILHANIVNDNLLYWVDGLNQARKTNIKKMFDKSITGYGAIIEQSFIDAYKQTAPLPPTGVYFSDTDKPFNRLYGQLTKYAQRFVYDDGEKSVYSDWSSVILPTKEPYNGINTIPTNNNGINVTVNTGNRLVKRIEIIVQASSGELNEEGLLPWRLIATVDKKELGLADYSSYVYKFYNDGNYPVVDQLEVIQPYIYMPDAPLCQAVAKRAMTYANGRQGFEVVDIDASVSVSYADLFIEDNVENEFNEPLFTVVLGEENYVKNDFVTRYDGTTFKTLGGRFNVHTITVGSDVKEGNQFIFSTGNGLIKNQFNFTVIALISDNAITIANKIKSQLIATGRIFKKTPKIAGVHDIYSNTTDGDGNITFSYIIATKDHDGGYMGATANAIPVEFDSLKDTGESVRNIKMGSTIKLGIEYEDFDGKKSLTYTTDALVVGIKPANDDGIKASTIRLQINHKAPIWAKYYQITRTTDLRYNDFIQILIQNVVEVPTTNTDNYLDLVIGSFYTYQKLHPNSNLNFQFEKGDRISLLKKQDGSYYDFFETEVLSYNETVTDRVKANLVTNGTTTVTVASASIGNVGKFILVDGVERTIINAPSPTTYLVDNPIGEVTAKTYLYYDLIDRRGTLRIRKPAITIEPNSIIEVYKPSSASPTDKTFWEFQKKFPIINPGTVDAYHGGNPQNQTVSLPALVDISEGTVYVRSREMPLNNEVPGTQVQIVTVEDPSYSDFYPSLFNDNGRVNAEDNAQGVVEFGSRMWFSNNYIEDTEINGLGYFINTNREDYNDEYGDIMLTKFEENKIFTFKQLRTAYVPVDARITQDNADLSMLVNTGKLLNPIQYLAWEGGIGNNPESWISDGTHQYFVSPNSGVVIRLGGNGEEPISKTYQVDNEVRQELIDAYNNGARIFGGFDRKNGVYLFSIDSYFQYIYSDGFNDNNWRVTIPPPDAVYEIVLNPDHGDVDFSDPTLWVYTPDTDYVGADSFTYRAFYDGEWTEPTKVCLDIVENLNRQKGWRPINPYCMVYGSYQGYDDLEEYYLDDLTATGVTKPNVVTDADYVSPIYAIETCPAKFGNVYMAQSFTRNNCVPGEIGLSVQYEVFENTHYADTQEEADEAAQEDIDDNGQAFANANADCIPVTYFSSLATKVVSRNNCEDDQTTLPVTYIVPLGKYQSYISQADADAKAQADITLNSQDWANENGECIDPVYWNEVQSISIGRNNCGPGQEGTLITYTVPAHSYSASSQYLANQEALADIADNAQDYANDPVNGSICKPIGSFGNQEITLEFTKEGCVSGEPTVFTFTYAANQIFASSQVIADALATDIFEIEGQDMANDDERGICGDFPNIPCGETHTLVAGMPTVQYIAIDENAGSFDVGYTAIGGASKIVGSIDGIEVFDTGYFGNILYQDALDAALTVLSLPTEPIVASETGTVNTIKGITGNLLKLEIYSPIDGSSTEVSTTCVNVVYTPRWIVDTEYCDCNMTFDFVITGETETTTSLQVVPVGGTGPYTYSWSTGNTTNTITGALKSSAYTITVVDSVGCTFTEEVIPNVLILEGATIEMFHLNEPSTDPDDYFYPRTTCGVGYLYCDHYSKYELFANGESQGIFSLNNDYFHSDNPIHEWANDEFNFVPFPYPNPSRIYQNDDRYVGKQISKEMAELLSTVDGKIIFGLIWTQTGEVQVSDHQAFHRVRVIRKDGTVILDMCLNGLNDYTLDLYS